MPRRCRHLQQSDGVTVHDQTLEHVMVKYNVCATVLELDYRIVFYNQISNGLNPLVRINLRKLQTDDFEEGVLED